MKLVTIARIKSDFPAKFGIPRQSGLANSLVSYVVLEPQYAVKEAFAGLEGFSHIWLIWGFSENFGSKWSPTVRPPRLGGNIRKGVFATRSPFRPNPLGLSCVKLLDIKPGVLTIGGADLMDQTPIYDIKPYLPLCDSKENASDGFAGEVKDYSLTVDFPQSLCGILKPEKENALREILSQDPRPAYQNDETRVYGFFFAGYEIKFRVSNDILTVIEITEEHT